MSEETNKQFNYDQIGDIAFGLMIECVICAMKAEEQQRSSGAGEQLDMMAALGEAGREFAMFTHALEEGIKELLTQRKELKKQLEAAHALILAAGAKEEVPNAE